MDEKELKEKVRKILQQNLVEGYSKSKGCDYTFIKPSKNFYRFQFFWDSCFHVCILCVLGETDTAKKCFSSLFAMQEDSGFIGHIHYWNNVLPSRITDVFQSRPGNGFDLLRSHTSALLQPPIIAQALYRVYEATGDREYLAEMLPKLKKYYNWIAEHRDFDDSGLLTIITSFESGMDWKASYDEVVNFPRKQADYRLFIKMIGIDFSNFIVNYDPEKIKARDRFCVKDVCFNTVYIQNLRVMANLCRELKDDEAAKIYTERADKALTSMTELMWDEEDEAFYDLCGKENKKLKVLTPSIFFPVVIDGIPKDLKKKVLKRHFYNEDEFYTKYPIPSLAVNDPAFSEKESLFLWRGPTWIFHNWYLHKYLKNNGYEDEANCLMHAVTDFIEKSGFREYYDPFTAEGHGAHNFTWAGLVLDMMDLEKKSS